MHAVAKAVGVALGHVGDVVGGAGQRQRRGKAAHAQVQLAPQAQTFQRLVHTLLPARAMGHADVPASDVGLQFVQPVEFPQQTLLASRVALVALSEDWGEDFCRAVYRAEFAEGRNIAEPFVIADILNRLGQSPEDVLEEARGDAIKNALRGQTEEAQRLGIFGAPSFITGDGELFWGNDRLEAALEWARR